MKSIEIIKRKLTNYGWNINELIFEQVIYAQNFDRGYRASVVLAYRSYFLGIVDVPPIGIALSDYAQQLYSDVANLDIPNVFVFYNGEFLRLELGGEIELDKPIELTPDRAIQLRMGSSSVLTISDPRFADLSWQIGPLGLTQLLAVSRTLDALVRGQKVALIEMPAGSGKSHVQATIVVKLIQTGFVAQVVIVASSKATVDILSRAYQTTGLSVETIFQEGGSRAQIVIGSPKVLVSPLREGIFDGDRPRLVVIDDPYYFDSPEYNEVLAALKCEILLGLSSIPILSPPFVGNTTYKRTLGQSMEELPAPADFLAYELGSLATVQQGLPIIKSSGAEGALTVSVISTRSISDDGSLSFDSQGTVDSNQGDVFRLVKGDILVSAAGATRKIAFVELTPPAPAIFASSLIRIRAVDSAMALMLFKFLSSSLGISILDKISNGTVQKHLNVGSLRKMLVYLSPAEVMAMEGGQPVEEPRSLVEVELTKELSVLKVLKSEIIPMLEEFSKLPSADDRISIQHVATKLSQLAIDLGGKKIEEHVLDSFPSPIALAYRRYRDARFNVFEQVLRLRDLAEACTFFIYNVFLIDYFRNLSRQGYGIQDKGARKAYTGYSMAARIDFVAELLAQSREKTGKELFLAELVEFTTFSQTARLLNEDLRNSLSHTAAASESQQLAIMERFVPIVLGYLEGLKFLTAYRLAKVPAYYAKDGKLYRRVEVYAGVSPYIDEEEIANSDVDAGISRDHLVLVSPEGTMLNLHPLYQLVSNADTRHESHICLFKQRKNGVLQGESVQGSFAIDMNDREYFERLIPSSEV